MVKALVVIALCLAMWVLIAFEQVAAGDDVVNCRQDNYTCKLCCDNYREYHTHKLWVRKIRHNICGCTNRYGQFYESLVKMKTVNGKKVIEIAT